MVLHLPLSVPWIKVSEKQMHSSHLQQAHMQTEGVGVEQFQSGRLVLRYVISFQESQKPYESLA